MIDYHLHLWPHSESSVWFRLDQIAAYCDEAARHGVNELALTEHSHRFVDVAAVVGPFWERFGHEPTSQTMAAYWDFHARNSLEEYVTLAQRAKDEGLPVKIGLEVDYYKDQMGAVSELLAQYPFDVLIGSVHWLGTWHLDDYESEVNLNEWRVRDVDQCWHDYAIAIDELCASNAVDVLAHPDLIKVAGFFASSPGDTWDAMAESAAKANVSMECSSAGWGKPVGEQYPAEGFLDRLVAKGLTFTTASDAHHNERVGERVGDLAALLEARGVHEVASYTGRQRRMIPLRVS
ncbi:MAG TPA: PHP domain-containing protein [Acidimicrobiales bacterium]|nr:PHP domain-containing protein [Acidimicrobiales bacterium]